ncbi:DNA-binding protein [Enterococcus saccharolyticus]|uniref:DNA-binding protein n=1 Tax=Candidatus Enterococcus willemsii TaxID=1857215 RepID=A0ABQ6YVG3_9ENTE|nr:MULTISPECIES: S1-like domain-containing RNA-binding protein [Enterococcus]KAF1301073.1 DNA-binding protein [Enterococcus sp. CU12B]MCD5001120.1 DNA-binding protein [Enterococcus saccharolyticus]
MNELLASVFSGLIIDENEENYFVQKNGVTFKLAKSEGEHALGEAVEGFGYQNQKQDYCMTTIIPKSRKGHYAFGEVTDSRRDLGVFVNIGLPDKDVAVSLDELPTMRELWPKKGDRLMVSLRVDHKDRIWGSLAEEKIFQALSKRGNDTLKNQDVTGTVYRLKLVGTYILTDDFYIGFIHPSERFQEPRLGEQVKGRVIGVRPDGVLNLSLKPRAHEAISDDAAMIVAFLERAPENQMNYTDKSSPEEIKQMFGISKGQFKRALGNLMKQRMVEQKDGVTKLIKKSN